MTWKNLKIGTKLFMGFGIVILLLIFLAFKTNSGLNDIHRYEQIASEFDHYSLLSLEMRFAEKKFILTKDKKYYTEMHTFQEKMVELYPETLSKLKAKEDRELVDHIKHNQTEYNRTFDEYVKLQEEISIIQSNMIEAGNEMVKQTEELLKDQNQQLINDFSRERVSKIGDANHLIILGGKIRIAEKNYMVRHDDQYYEELKDLFRNTKNQIADTKNSMKRTINRTQMDRMLTAVEKYESNVEKYIELDHEMNQSLAHMVKSAELMVTAAEEGADIALNKFNSHFSSIKNTTLIITLIVILASILIAFFITTVLNKEISIIITQLEVLVKKIFKGQLDSRGDKNKVGIDFKPLMSKINELTNTLVNFIDNVPVPVMTIDKDYNIQFMNKVGCSVGDSSLDRLKGTKCHEYFKTDDCNTSNCACKKAMISSTMESSQAEAHPAGKDMYINYTGTPLKDQEGNVIGALEAVLDSTESYNAMNLIKKQSIYQEKEVGKLVDNLNKVSDGNFTIDTHIADHDTDTKEIATNFTNINSGLQRTVDNLNSIAGQFNEISDAAENGTLEFRGRPNEYEGAYKTMVSIVNRVLDLIIQPVNEAISVMEKVADKNMNISVSGDYKGDLDAFKGFINKAVGNLDIALTQVSDGVIQVTSASDQISKGSQSLAEGANEQASSLEEISSSLEEMSSMTQQNADNATQANTLSQEANKSAENGNTSMVKMKEAISKIKTSSDETAKIIKTIDEIAFQTNLLALNAAVEAARAGDAGKGFAVVAEEVRNLAQRSAEAAKNTAEMIEESVKNSENGVVITEEVGQLLVDIKEGSGKVNDLISEIAAASKEQASGIEQVNTAVAQMNQVTQQNAANSEESASAAEELNAQASELSSLISSFELSNKAPMASTRIATPAHVMTPKLKQKKIQKIKSPEKVIPLDDEEFGDF